MRIAFPEGGDGGVFGVAGAALQPLEDQDPVALVLADAASDRLKGLTKGAGGFPLPFACVDLDAAAHVQRDHPIALHARPTMGPHLGVQVSTTDQRCGRGSPCNDHLHAAWTLAEGAHHVLDIEQSQVQDRIQFIEDHNGIERTGDRPLGDHPAAFRFVPVEARGLFRCEVIGSSGAQMVDQVWKTLLQSLDGGILVVSTPRTLQKPQQQNAGPALFTDSESDGPQHDAEGGLTLALAFAVIDVQLTMAAFTAVGCGDDPDASGHGVGSYGWSLPRSSGLRS